MGAQQSTPEPVITNVAGGLSKWEATVLEEETIHAASIPLKDVPSCMTLFDEWAKCFALGPQIRHVYRYGKTNDCKVKLEDFKFCLTLKGLEKDEHREQWIRRRAELAAGNRLEQSSEDVWEMRRDPIVDPAYADPNIPKPL